MLETFYYNNIHIDEILVVGAVSQDVSKQSDLNHNGDLYYNAFPLLRTLNLPNTKVTFVDYTKWFDNINNFSLINTYGNEWMKHIGGFHSVHNLFWYDLKKFVGATNNKETAVLFGAEKPKIEYSNSGRAFFRFSNLSFTDYGNNYHFENFHRVNFYTDDSPESIEIVKKQSHLVNRAIREAQAINMPVPDNKTIIYDFKNPLSFESIKSRTTILSARDTFMVNKRDSDIYKIYNESVNMFRDSSLQYLRKNNIYSRPYLLE
jgi:hypothetical protein